MSGNVPETLAPTMVVPSLAVVAAATAVLAGWAAVGLVNPGIVNAIGCAAANKLAAVAPKETVKTNKEPDKGVSAAVPVGTPVDGAENATAALPEDARANPAPLSVMMILPLFAICVIGVSVTLMVTAVAPLATLLRVMEGRAYPREWPMMPPVEMLPAEQALETVTT